MSSLAISAPRAARAALRLPISPTPAVSTLSPTISTTDPYFLKNQFPSHNYLAFRLTGTKSNRDAIGAVVTLHIGDEIMLRQVQAAGGYLSQSSNALHFGLGDRAAVDRAEIRWPSGRRQVIERPTINQLHKVVEPSK
jgi:hypothetical protein